MTRLICTIAQVAGYSAIYWVCIMNSLSTADMSIVVLGLVISGTASAIRGVD